MTVDPCPTGDSSRPRVLVFIQSVLFLRNYLRTDALASLERDFDCHFAVSDAVGDAPEFDERAGRVHRYRRDLASHGRHFRAYNVLMWRYRRRSSTFRFRIARTFAPKHPFRPGLGNLVHNARALGHRIGIAYRMARMAFISSDPWFQLYRWRILDRFRPGTDIARVIDEAAPALVIFPSTAYEPDSYDIIHHARASAIPTLFLIDNWDNLSSKTIMWAQPDHLAVWGEQSARHAVDIQRFPAERITPIGTPRFDRYFTVRERRLPSWFDFRYVLYIGSTLAYDEMPALRRLNAIVNVHPDVFGDLKILYRPHPWRQWSESSSGLDADLDRIVIDPQVAEHYAAGGTTGIAFQPDLDYYPLLLQNAEFVVGGLTSMLIEATIFGQRFIGFAHDDGSGLKNQANVYRYSEHLRGIEDIGQVEICHDLDDLERLVLDIWPRRREVDLAVADRERQDILYSDDVPYRERLSRLATRLVAADAAARQTAQADGV